ncbi:RNA polymerase sigma factor [Variovorax sp. 38R]|uniref:RNA polymerase sigma factor n=1 Tax=Variovorax sp. 38R TaxID=2774875 RepID=UPI0017857DF0|nr:sigma-70 family RNA polymerase sigma factor [Variovorax sp. 38R]QOF79720.1 sigma-70 family RNA polymerase sigma factor [Variovorax sp. 38R]
MNAFHPASAPAAVAPALRWRRTDAPVPNARRPAHDHRGHTLADLGAWHCPALLTAMEAVAPEAPAENHGAVLREFLAANYTRLRQRLQRHLGCPDLASDCLHDAWLRLGEMTVSEPVQSPEAYVYRVACNLAMDRLRSNRPWQYATDVASELEALADHSPGPDLIAEARSDLQAFERAMERLPRRHRSALIGLRIEEKSRQEVADWLRISLRSVDTALCQALDYCAEHMGQEVSTGVRTARRSLRVMPKPTPKPTGA